MPTTDHYTEAERLLSTTATPGHAATQYAAALTHAVLALIDTIKKATHE